MKKLLQNEVILYLIFGIATTLVYMFTRYCLMDLPASWAATLANIVAILFAFITNDTIVFKQARPGWPQRLVSFITARLFTMALDILLAWLLVDQFPQIIGQFVQHQEKWIKLIETLFAQASIIVLNYVLSKLFVFKSRQ